VVVTHTELLVLAWLVRGVGALALLVALFSLAIYLARWVARRTQTLGYLWRAMWIYARADFHEREAMRAANKRAMPHVPGLRREDDL